MLLVETAGLCLRCSPYVDGGLGIVVLEATSGMNLPRKIGPMLCLADIAVVTKIDLVSQAEREVFRARILDAAPAVRVREVNALHGIGIDPLVDRILRNAGRRRRAAAARQSAGRHLHDLRRQEGHRLAVALRRRPAAGEPDLLPRGVSPMTEPPHLLRPCRHHAAGPAVRAAMQPFLDEAFGNPPACTRRGGGREPPSKRPAADVAALVGAQPERGDLHERRHRGRQPGAASAWSQLAGSRAIVTSAIEHPAVLETCRAAGAQRSVSVVPAGR